MILVTGGTGLVGAHLLYHLAQENDIICAIYRSEEKCEAVKNIFSVYTPNYQRYFTKINWVKADITDIPSLEKIFSAHQITQVYHCAALVSFNPSDYYAMRKINIEGTANIVNLCIDNQVEKLCFVSSIATLGTPINAKYTTEKHEWSSETEKSEYSITKQGGEMEVWRASQEGIKVIIVNPGVILGGGFKNGSSKIFTQIKNGFSFYTEGITGFVGVKDVVKAMVLLMKSDIKNERFILVSENKSFKNIFFTIADTFNVKRPYIKVNKTITSIFWRLNWAFTKLTKKEPLLTKSSAKSSHHKEYYCSEKIKNTIPFTFEKINTVITETCKSYF